MLQLKQLSIQGIRSFDPDVPPIRTWEICWLFIRQEASEKPNLSVWRVPGRGTLDVLQQLNIQSIRSFNPDEPVDIKFSPLTIFLGPNDVGKTTIIGRRSFG
ncbi:DNA repair protein rad50 [Blomia tropicalis]|nr:DNA repair protein rad50 [Blomia tropicalis]